MSSNILSNRKVAVGLFFGILLSLLLLRLFQLQILNKKYGTGSDSVAVVQEIVKPSRGLIYDRNDTLIVYNTPVYDIYIQINQLKEGDTTKIANFLALEPNYVEEKISEAISKKFIVKPYPLLKRLSERDYAILQENLYQYPALSVQSSTERRYRYPNAAMVLGYLGEVDTKDIETSDGDYIMGDNIGKTGIEQSFEDTLKGVKGVQYLLRDKHNIIHGKFKEGEFDMNAIPGKDLTTTLDIELQHYAESLMNGKVGSIVAIEPSTGEILTMVSSPTYDPNWLTGRQRSTYFKALLVDSLNPMFNRAVSAEYPPGSTFKPLASLISLQDEAVTENFSFPCNGGYSLNRGKPGCHAHSQLSGVEDAIKQSCNSYYAEIFRRSMILDKYSSIKEALNAWGEYLMYFGYGKQFDIGIGGVRDGFFPSAEYYDQPHLYGGWDWGPMTIISLSIGQGETLATTLQMAQSTSVIASRGTVIEPHLIKKVGQNEVQLNDKLQAPIKKDYFEAVIDGMEQTFESGTARRSKIDSIKACGKTGTAENPHGKDHSLFISFAPKDNPKIAVAVIIENGGYGSTYAAPIASLVMEKYLKDSIPTNRKFLEQQMLDANLIGFEKENYLAYIAEQQERKRKREENQKRLDSLNQPGIEGTE